jgi:hypothetical protein
MNKRVKNYRFAIIRLIVVVCIAQSLMGCKKLLEIDPPIQSLTSGAIYKSDATAAGVLNGIYSQIGGTIGGRRSIGMKTGLSADELVSVAEPSDVLTMLYKNSLTREGSQLDWPNLYNIIFHCNSAINGLDASSTLSSGVKNQLLGEAYFVRAFAYFYLVNEYGNCPLIVSTNLEENRNKGRTDVESVYSQIVSDLQFSLTKLSDQYLSGNATNVVSDRLRPTRNGAKALLARVFLYKKEWSQAEQFASEVISNGNYDLEPLASSFLSTSKETIWSIQSIENGINTTDGTIYVLKGGTLGIEGPDPDFRPVFMSESLFNSFEASDLRKKTWIDSILVGGKTYPFAYKYKIYQIDPDKKENLVVLRLSEQYLIRAEARAHLGKLTGSNSATSYINRIRNRAGLDPINLLSLDDAVNAILEERQHELFLEWGHRWFDLKRTGKIDDVMNVVSNSKGGIWQAYKALFPIPTFDFQGNQNLRGHQNPGYPEL